MIVRPEISEVSGHSSLVTSAVPLITDRQTNTGGNLVVQDHLRAAKNGVYKQVVHSFLDRRSLWKQKCYYKHLRKK